MNIQPPLMVSQCYEGSVSGVAQRVREQENPARSAMYIYMASITG